MKKKTGILSKIYIAILLIFLYSPIAVLIFYSFNNGKTTVWKGFTFKWYVQLFRDDNIMNALWNTVIIAVLASIFATILGTAAANDAPNGARLPRTAPRDTKIPQSRQPAFVSIFRIKSP